MGPPPRFYAIQSERRGLFAIAVMGKSLRRPGGIMPPNPLDGKTGLSTA